MNPDVVKRYSAPVPRYTSYPTAPHFHAGIDDAKFAEWLQALPAYARLSLYMHIPFCHELCWYCGCSTKAVQRYAPIAAYLERLKAEVTAVAGHLKVEHTVTDVHWGGGSPNALSAAGIIELNHAMRAEFNVHRNVEFAVEIDPRNLGEDQVEAFATAGVTRASFGVQDFNADVQKAINRLQSFEITQRAVGWFRARGVQAVNIDLVYGLPHQTRDSVADTVRKVLELNPDRIAIFGYAHLPSRLKHQRLINETALPDVVERFAQSNRVTHILQAAGYVRIGLDHFSRADDPLVTRPVNRNFQGYTSDAADALLGLGASAISRLPQGYAQNVVATSEYMRRIDDGRLATARGRALTYEDRMRGFVIERLMCDLTFAEDELRERFGDAAAPLIDEARSLVETDQDHLVERTCDGFRVTDRGRPFVRTIAACFDSYLGQGQTLYSQGV